MERTQTDAALFATLPKQLRAALSRVNVTSFADLERDWDMQWLQKTPGVANAYAKRLAAVMDARGTPLPDWPAWRKNGPG
jgi:hypothetical protein